MFKNCLKLSSKTCHILAFSLVKSSLFVIIECTRHNDLRYLDDERSVSINLVSWNTLVHDMINLYFIMNNEQTSEKFFTYIKMHYGETIRAKRRKIEKALIKYSSYTNHLQFSPRCHCNKILSKYLQLKNRIKTELIKTILQRAGKMLLQEWMHIIHDVCDSFNISIK